ncbi:MAG: hypothetical protein QXO70_04850 [Candidatus Pacearchaeota archaeon]
MDYKEINKNLFKKAEIFTLSTFGILVLGLWAFFEASFWFIAPDFIIGLFCFLAPKKNRKFILTALFISLIGGFCYYLFTVNNFELATNILHNTPFVSEENINFVKAIYSKNGVYATILQAITLIPFKIWTNLVVLNKFDPLVYFFLVGLSRLFRFFLVGMIAIYLRKRIEKFARDNFIVLLITYSVLFLTITYILES